MGEQISDIIDRIRQKPEPTRWGLLVAITAMIALLLLGFFIWNITRQIASVSQNGDETAGLQSVVSPIESLKESIDALRDGKAPTVPGSSHPAGEEEERSDRFFQRAGEVIKYNWELIKGMF